MVHIWFLIPLNTRMMIPLLLSYTEKYTGKKRDHTRETDRSVRNKQIIDVLPSSYVWCRCQYDTLLEKHELLFYFCALTTVTLQKKFPPPPANLSVWSQKQQQQNKQQNKQTNKEPHTETLIIAYVHTHVMYQR